MTTTAIAKKPGTSKAELQTIEAIRAYTADTLKHFKTNPLNRYEAGFQASFEEFGRALDPAGYNRDRPRAALIAALQKAPAVKSKAALQSVQAVHEYLDEYFAGVKEDPSDNRYLYGYEDANWRLWSLVHPMGYTATLNYLPD